MKKCPYCAEEIQDEALKCKFCGENLNKKIDGKDKFQKYIQFIHANYTQYRIEEKNYNDNYIVLRKEVSRFNCFIFFILLLLGLLPGIIYLIVVMNQDKVIALTVYFDDNGEPEHISNQQFQFLVDRYKNPNMQTATDKYLNPNKMIKVTLIILAICTFPFSLPFIIWYKVAQKKNKQTK